MEDLEKEEKSAFEYGDLDDRKPKFSLKNVGNNDQSTMGVESNSNNMSINKSVNFAATVHVSTITDGDSMSTTAPHTAAAAAAAAMAAKPIKLAAPGDVRPVDELSDGISTCTSTDGVYEVIEYDPFDNSLTVGIPEELLNEIEPTIEENTPAAEALRANASVHVSTMGKAARAVNMQAVRRFVKRATGKTKSGVVRGKPPRLPPHAIHGTGESDDGDWETDDGLADAQQSRTLEPIAEHEEHVEGTPDQPSGFVSSPQQHPQPSTSSLTPAPTSTAPGGVMATPSGASTTSELHKPLDGDVAIPDTIVAGTAEAGKKVLGEVDPHDMLKLLRWRRKKRGGHKETKSYVKGKVIDGEHELYTLSIAVMIGVRTSISKTNTLLNSGPGKRWIQPSDFRAMEKYEFRPKGGKLPPHQLAHTFKFKDYAPIAFAYLRRMYGVNEFDFLLSVCGNANFIEFISNAKSGQFFFYSSDGRYMIKTMTNAESKFLRRILPKYFRHCAENPNTMITRFFGMYRVKLYHLRRNVKFVVMNSVYYTDKYLQVFYDLKGSVIGRDAKPGQAVRKDNDLRRLLPREALALPPRVRKPVRGQIDSDLNFLSRMGIMDYSMLVGVHHIPPKSEASKYANVGFRGSFKNLNMSRRQLLKKDDSESNHENGDVHIGGSPKKPCAPPGEGDSVDHLNLDDFSESQPKSDRDLAHRRTTTGDFSESQPKSDRDMTHRKTTSDQVSAILFDDGLEDDDSSYLLGSPKRTNNSSGNPRTHEETEIKKQATIEKLYWPFHRLFDIHGHRRMVPVRCPFCKDKPCSCGDDDELLQGYNIPKFLAPLSDRKDGGLEMDTTGLQLPIKISGPHGKEQLADGKIFYMGIIDILQEYTSRKKVEAQYRYLQSAGKLEASCVPPPDYAERFIKFFDEYSQREPEAEVGIETDLSGVLAESTSSFAEH